MAVQIDILYTKDCTDWEETARLVQQALDDLGLEGDFIYTLVNSDREAMELHFIGSPTVLLDGVDPWPMPNAPAGTRLRPYFTPEGMADHPTYDMIVEALQPYLS
jgi:hypothetical protein